MSRTRLSDVVRRWTRKFRRPVGAPRRTRSLSFLEYEQRIAPAVLPGSSVFESRFLTNYGPYNPNPPAGPATPYQAFDAVSAVDPNDPRKIVQISVRAVQNNNGLPAQFSEFAVKQWGLVGQYTLDGGHSWLNLVDGSPVSGGQPALLNTSTANFPLSSQPASPPLAWLLQRATTVTHESHPSVAFARDGQVYIAYEQDLKSFHFPVYKSGRVMLSSFSFTGNTPEIDPFTGKLALTNRTMYSWADIDPSFNPTVAVNNNLPTYTDPQTGKTYTDPLNSHDPGNAKYAATPVYVGWNLQGTATSFSENLAPGDVFDPNAIYVAGSFDKGVTFTSPQTVNSGGHFPGPVVQGGTTPQIMFTPLQSDGVGRMVFLWNRVAGGVRYDVTQPSVNPATGNPFSNGTPFIYAASGAMPIPTPPGTPLPIADAIQGASGAPDTPFPTDFFTSTIDVSGVADFALSDVTVSIALSNQSRDLRDYQMDLFAPNASKSIRLLNAGVFSKDGASVNPNPLTGFPTGLFPADKFMGATVGGNSGATIGSTTFSDAGARKINDPLNFSPYTGIYRPESNKTFLEVFGGLTSATGELSGQWKLRITDVRNDRTATIASISKFSVQLSSGLPKGLGKDTSLPNAASLATGVDPLANPSPNPTLSPFVGIGAGLTTAVDNTLGTFSPTAGNVYVAFTSSDPKAKATPARTTNTDIQLYSGRWNAAANNFDWGATQVNDDSAADNVTEGVRTQFGPAITVDNANGTVVATWYDARNDASNARVARYFATSIDGGATFSPQVFLNAPKVAVDAITNRTVVLEPVPDNMAVVDPPPVPTPNHGFGSTQSVIAYDGKAVAFWTGNQNLAGRSNVLTAYAQYASGPRVVGADMGSVSDDLVTYALDGRAVARNPADPDGTRKLDGFRITFDRPIQPETVLSKTSGVLNKTIPDGSPAVPGLVQSSLALPALPAGQVLGGFFVTLDITHPRVITNTAPGGDLLVRLIAPGGQSIVLVNQMLDKAGFDAADLSNVRFDLGAPTSIRFATSNDAPFTGVWAPADKNALAALYGTAQPAGNWTLVVTDNQIGPFPPPPPGPPVPPPPAITGRLNSWGITVVGNTYKFGKNDVTVMYRDTATPSGQYGKAVTVGAPVPLGTEGGPTSAFGVTSFFVPFTTPQTAVGTYSYAVGPNVQDWVQRTDGRYGLPVGAAATSWVVLDPVSTQEAPQVPILGGTRPADFPANPPASPFGKPFASGALNLPIPDANPITGAPGIVSHAIPVPGFPVGSGQVIGEILIDINVTHPRIADAAGGDLQFTLIAPGGQSVNLVSNMGLGAVSTAQGPGRNFTNTRFDVRATRSINAALTTDSPGFTGAWRPADLAAFRALFGSNPAGQWTLRITDTGIANAGTLLDWAITVLPGRVVTAANPQLGNWLDQDNDGRALELPSIFPTSNDVFAVPKPVNGTPFLLPYDAATLPLMISGPRLVGINQPGPAPAVAGATINFVPGPYVPPINGGPVGTPVIDITLDRLVDPATFDADGRDIEQIIPPAALGKPAITGPFVVQHLGGPNYRIYSNGVSFPYDPGTPFDPPYTAASVVFKSTAEFRTDNEVTLNGPTNTVRLTFDRPMNGTSFDATDIVKLTGPVGDIPGPFTVKAVPGDAKSFDVGFTTQVLSGSYQFELAPGITSALGHAVDTDRDAGLDVLRGIDPNAAKYTTVTRQTSPGAVAIGPFATVSMPLSIADDFTIKQLITSDLNPVNSKLVSVRLNITFPNDPDLQADLVAPSGARVRLFTGVGTLGIPPRANFTNTVLNDLGATAIQSGTAPFNGTFTPQFPLSALNGVGANGTWRLEVTNNAGQSGNIVDWSLTLPTTVLGTGLGEAVADRFTAGFRIFTADPTIDLTQKVWAPVGAAPVNRLDNGNPTNSGRVTSVAVDPSDPSGNTVYVGGATGGVWKTTNFLTLDPKGPNWLPLTDLGSTFSLNIANILLVPVNNDPNQTMVFALTGAGGFPAGTTGAQPTNPTTPGTALGGVGILRSTDGGKSWKILDSTSNADPAGNIYPIDAPTGTGAGQRDRLFFNANGFKIIADPTPLSNGERILYMAVSGNAAQRGIWRSTNTGKTWTRIQQGNATDVVLGAGSFGANGNLTRLYAAIGGDGVYTTSQATSALSLSRMIGNDGNNLIVQGTNQPVPVAQPAGTDPNFGSGRYVIAAPAVTNSPLLNTFYRDWLYVARVNANGTFDGMWMTKDFGRNWTRIHIPQFVDDGGFIWGTNDESKADVNRHANTIRVPRQGGVGNQTLSLTVNPLDPNIVYLGGVYGARIDTTALNTPQTFVYHDHSDALVGAQVTPNTVGGTSALGVNQTNPGLLLPGSDKAVYPTGFLNLQRDPFNPFIQNATLRVKDEVPPDAPPLYNTASFTNDGQNAQWTPFENILQIGSPSLMYSDLTSMVPVIDPTTGGVRLVVGTRFGVVSGVDSLSKFGTGGLIPGIGFSTLPGNNRNGNLQLEQLYSGAAQPSVLAADVAGALFYGMSQDNGWLVSPSDILQTGDLNWLTEIGPNDVRNLAGSTGIGSAADQTGTGSAYQYRLPCCYEPGPGQTIQPSDYFRVFDPSTNHAGPGVSRTNGLVQGGDIPGLDAGQWPYKDNDVGYFTVNPIDPNGIVIASRQGRVFRTQDKGVQWTPIAEPGVLDGTYARALAYGAPNPGDSVPGLLNNFIYVGTNGGNVFVTRVGDGQWRNISAGLPGDGLMQIVANPRRGSRDAFAVTRNGVFYIADSGDPADGFATTTPWVNVTANLFQLRKAVFGDANAAGLPAGGPSTALPYAMKSITSIVADWRYAIPVDPSDPNSPTYPVLYVAGDGGVVRSVNALSAVAQPSWTIFPGASVFNEPTTGTNVAIPTGGYLPASLVTDLDLSMGNISTLDGQPQSAGSLNMLVASTWGRGTWAIRLEVPPEVAPFLVTGNSGARVVGVSTTNSKNTLLVRFDEPIDPTKFTPSDITLRAPETSPGVPGPVIPVTSVTTVPNSFGGSLDRRNLFQLTFADQVTTGFYDLIIGPFVQDFAGRPMNQDGDITNGETALSYTGFAEDAYVGFVYLDPANQTKGNLFIDMPLATRAGDPTPVTISAAAGTAVIVNGAPAGNPDAGYDHIVSISTTDKSARLISFSPAPPLFPAYDYQFTDQDFGSRTFNFEFQSAGQQFVTVVDQGGGTGPNYNQAKAQIFVHGGVAKRLDVQGFPDPTTAGDPGSITVIARDDFKNASNGFLGNVSDLYAGTVRFSSNDPLVSIGNGLPTDYTFTKADGGVHTFVNGVVLKTAGERTVTVVDVNKAEINGAQTDITVNPAVADHIIMTGIVPDPVVAGSPASFAIIAQDRFNNLATGYLGTLTFASDDPQISPGNGLPLDYTFTAADKGAHVFLNEVTFKTAGLKTLTATDTTNFLLFASDQVTVSPAAAGSFAVSGFPNPTTAGVPGIFTVTALDPFGNVATGYKGTVHFTSSDPQASLPIDTDFKAVNAGKISVGANLKTAGLQSITATDTANAALTGTQSGILVKAAAASKFFMTGLPPATTAGAQVSFTLTAKDPFGNIATGYEGLVRFANTDTKATAIPDYVFVPSDAGDRDFQVRFKTAGPQTVSAFDATTPTMTASQNTVVSAAGMAGFTVSGLPNPTAAGVPASFTVAARDAFGNVITGYTGTVHFTSSDPQVQVGNGLPADYTFTAGDAGVHTFAGGAVLKTAGTQTVVATDLANPAFSDGQSTVVTPTIASRFDVTGFPSPVVTGTAGTFTVTARDQFGNVATGYKGTAKFTSSDPAVAPGKGLPVTYPFQPADAGVRVFSATLKTVGTQSITATDLASASITGTQAGIEVVPVPPPPPNQPPTISDVTNVEVPFNGSAGPIVFTIGDAETPVSALTVVASSSNAGLLPVNKIALGGSGATRTVTLTPASGAFGTAIVTLTVTDAAGGTATDTFTVTVPEPVGPPPPPGANDPTITDLPNIVVAYNGSTGAIPFTVDDKQTAPAALVVTATSSNATLLPTGNIGLGGTGTNRTITLTPAANQFGSTVVTLTVTDLDGNTATDTFTVTVPPPDGGGGIPQGRALPSVTAVGTGAGAGNLVDVYRADGTELRQFIPYAQTFTGGTRTAIARTPLGDWLVVAPGPGTVTNVLIFDLASGNLIRSFEPFESSFTGGMFVSAGDLNADGFDDVVVTPDVGGGPRARVLSGADGSTVADFLGIDDPNFRGGARSAVGDFNGDGRQDLVVAAGFGGGPRVAMFDGTTVPSNHPGRLLADFFVFEQTLRNGVYVTAGDVNGDGRAELIVGGGPGGGPRVMALDGQAVTTGDTSKVVFNFFAGNTENRGGVRVAMKDLDGDNQADLVVGDGEGAGSRVTAYPGRVLVTGVTPAPIFSFEELPGFTGGVFVG